MRRIADLELAKTAARMADRGIGLEVSNSLMERITAEGEASLWCWEAVVLPRAERC